jgi:hypothetical protein
MIKVTPLSLSPGLISYARVPYAPGRLELEPNLRRLFSVFFYIALSPICRAEIFSLLRHLTSYQRRDPLICWWGYRAGSLSGDQSMVIKPTLSGYSGFGDPFELTTCSSYSQVAAHDLYSLCVG